MGVCAARVLVCGVSKGSMRGGLKQICYTSYVCEEGRV